MNKVTGVGIIRSCIYGGIYRYICILGFIYISLVVPATGETAA